MAEQSSESMAVKMGAVQEKTADRTMLVAAAWLATLLLSKLPLVIARELLGSDIPWIIPAWIGTALVLVAATYVWGALRPLRGYFAIMGVILLVTAGFETLLRGTAIWQGFAAGQSEMVSILRDRVLILLETLVVLACLLFLGYKRREAFLVVGDLTAPVGGQSATRKRTLSWAVFGSVMAVVLGGSFFAFLVTQNPGLLSNLSAVLPWIPVILLAAALNAFGEEGMYRAAPLATLVSPVGARQALWMTSIWFGLGHYYGGFPSGIIGFVYTGLIGLLLGKAMLDTRGMGWSWTIHFVVDTVIYSVIAMTM